MHVLSFFGRSSLLCRVSSRYAAVGGRVTLLTHGPTRRFSYNRVEVGPKGDGPRITHVVGVSCYVISFRVQTYLVPSVTSFEKYLGGSSVPAYKARGWYERGGSNVRGVVMLALGGTV